MNDEHVPEMQKGTYCHAKTGNVYEVIGVAIHTETNEPLVVYRPKYESAHEYFVRPYEMFFESIEIDRVTQPRFMKID